MIRLIQCQLHVYRLIVQRDIRKIRIGQIDHAYFSHAEVCGDMIFDFAGPRQYHLDFVKIRVLQRPQMLLFNAYFKLYFPGSFVDHFSNNRIRQVVRLELKFQANIRRGGFVKNRLDCDFPAVDIRCEMNRLQSHNRAGFQIDGLPYSGGPAVALLALQFEFMRSVISLQDQAMRFSFFQMRRKIELERSVASLVIAKQISIQPGGRVPVAGADNEKDPLSRP